MEKIFARNTTAARIENNQAIEFTKKYHRQGFPFGAKNVRSYGLFYEGKLYATAIFSNPRTKGVQAKFSTELLRLTFPENVRITGGASKLIKFFISQEKPWDVFTYQTLAGENSDVYQHSGLDLVSSRKTKEVLVKNGLTVSTATNNFMDWFSLEQAAGNGPDRLLGTKLGEVFNENGERLTNIQLFTEKCGYHLETIPGDNVYAWINPEVNFYIYKITSSIDDGYYIGRRFIRKNNPSVEDCLNDPYMGSGGKKFQNWVELVGVETLMKEVLGIYPTWEEIVKAERTAIGDSHISDPNCMNFQPGGMGLGKSITNIELKKCSIHGETLFNGKSCCRCSVAKQFYTDTCEKHGETTFKSDFCMKCKTKSMFSIKTCKIHGETKHRGSNCTTCSSKSLLNTQTCPTHGFVIHFGDTCATCTSQKSVSRKNCEIHGMVTHQGDVCSTCNSLKALTIQTCSIHGETKYLGSHCMKCNAANQLTEKTCKKHGVVLHKGDSCTFCTAQKSVNMKLCGTHPVEHGVTKHQGDVCNKCNALNSVSMKECLKHGLTKHQGNVCNKCNSRKSVVLSDCTVHGSNVKFQGGKCSSCTNASLIKVKECAVHGMWKHRGNSCYACVSDRRKAATLAKKATAK